ncbi:hypothetical protein PR048_020401 [Dryococelus australis]|uniref:Uncharacterized protein n=1 Tax=Dryococelus australis TaxID=614101 RepID=A0ABQ9H6A1_9NEOP|nr:hypothetical protein PR048_020401 [Dryococelus australis]
MEQRIDWLSGEREIPSGALVAQWIERFQVGPQWISGWNYIKWGLSGSVEREIPSGALVAQWIERFQVGLQWHNIHITPRGRGGLVARLLASHLGEQCPIPGGGAPGFSQVGIVQDDAASRRVLSGISCFPHPCIPVWWVMKVEDGVSWDLMKDGKKQKQGGKVSRERKVDCSRHARGRMLLSCEIPVHLKHRLQPHASGTVRKTSTLTDQLLFFSLLPNAYDLVYRWAGLSFPYGGILRRLECREYESLVEENKKKLVAINKNNSPLRTTMISFKKAHECGEVTPELPAGHQRHLQPEVPVLKTAIAALSSPSSYTHLEILTRVAGRHAHHKRRQPPRLSARIGVGLRSTFRQYDTFSSNLALNHRGTLGNLDTETPRQLG